MEAPTGGVLEENPKDAGISEVPAYESKGGVMLRGEKRQGGHGGHGRHGREGGGGEKSDSKREAGQTYKRSCWRWHWSDRFCYCPLEVLHLTLCLMQLQPHL